jgi:polygalacturonase
MKTIAILLGLLPIVVTAQVITYPTPPGLVTSRDFTVTANGKQVWVEKIGSDVHTAKYALYGGIAMEYLNVASFACSGSVSITITASSPIDSFVIRPKSRHVQAKVNGRQLTFMISGPQKLYIEINALPHLAVFADPPEVNVPQPGDPGVVYFGAGAHDPGSIRLKSNQTIYIAPGAIVNANVRGDNLQNVKIIGRGRLQGNVEISRTTNLAVNGVFIRNTKGWSNMLTDCHHSLYKNVKVFGYEDIYSVDGINPVSCKDFTIDDCFMRCRDDCVAIKSIDYKLNVDSIRVINSVMVGWSNSDGVTIGFELNGGPVQNVLVKNCDILYARGNGRTGGHSGFGIVCDGPARVQNIRYEDIRVEEHVEFKNLELIISDGKLYGDDPPGHISGVYFRNIHWENRSKPFILSGFSADNTIDNITFEHCTVGGKKLASASDADFKINRFVKGVKFLE